MYVKPISRQSPDRWSDSTSTGKGDHSPKTLNKLPDEGHERPGRLALIDEPVNMPHGLRRCPRVDYHRHSGLEPLNLARKLCSAAATQHVVGKDQANRSIPG